MGRGPLACALAAGLVTWYASPENQAAARQSGATFRIFTIEGLPPGS